MYEPEESGGGGADLDGQLTFEGGCLYLDSEANNERFVLVFPADDITEVDDELHTFHYQGQEYGDGDHIEVGGGGSGTLTSVAEWDNSVVPDSCEETTRVFIVASR